ncbi:GNAT family N-acetyltransferase [Ensifer canadensis]
MNIVVRKARTEDVEAIFDIRTSVVQNHLSRQQLSEMGITPATLSEILATGAGVWLAEVNGSPAAFSSIDDEDGCVFALFVNPAFEGLGLGRLLLLEAETALFRNHETIWLETDGRDGIRANGFYRKHGWTHVDTMANGDVRYEKRRAK